jgi:hypothetical protein
MEAGDKAGGYELRQGYRLYFISSVSESATLVICDFSESNKCHASHVIIPLVLYSPTALSLDSPDMGDGVLPVSSYTVNYKYAHIFQA